MEGEPRSSSESAPLSTPPVEQPAAPPTPPERTGQPTSRPGGDTDRPRGRTDGSGSSGSGRTEGGSSTSRPGGDTDRPRGRTDGSGSSGSGRTEGGSSTSRPGGGADQPPASRNAPRGNIDKFFTDQDARSRGTDDGGYRPGASSRDRRAQRLAGIADQIDRDRAQQERETGKPAVRPKESQGKPIIKSNKRRPKP